ncbi:MAG: hypothetical protein PIR53_02665 [Nocardioides alkalitolerans]
MAKNTGTGNTPNRTLRIPDDVWEAAKAEAARRDETLTDAVIGFLRRYARPKK